MLTAGTFCRSHQRDRPNASARGYDNNWRRYSVAYLERNRWCYYCGLRRVRTRAECVDHATPISRGGSKLDPENHRPSCTRCNVTKGNRTEAEFLSAVSG